MQGTEPKRVLIINNMCLTVLFCLTIVFIFASFQHYSILQRLVEICVNGVIPLLSLNVTIMSFGIDVFNTFTIVISNVCWILWIFKSKKDSYNKG